jgi:hypothetical protein
MGRKWVCFAKGGIYSPFYSDVYLVVGWDFSRQTFVDFFGRAGRMTERPEASGHFFKPGITWPRRTNSGFGPRVLPSSCIFSDKGPSIFVEKGHEYIKLGILLSRTYHKIIYMFMYNGDESSSGTISRSYEVGVIQKLPWPTYEISKLSVLTNDMREIVEGVRALDAHEETAACFQKTVASGSASLHEAALNDQRTVERHQCDLIDKAASMEASRRSSYFNCRKYRLLFRRVLPWTLGCPICN